MSGIRFCLPALAGLFFHIAAAAEGYTENPGTGERTAAALKAKGYHHRYVFSRGTGHCDRRVFEQTLADTLVWVWRCYHAE